MSPKLSLAHRLSIYEELLHKWGKVVNLVSPATLKDCRMRHFDDSLQLVPLISPEAKILFDLGSGAGFPGLVLAMARPDLEVHLVESDQKKCNFLSAVSRETLTPVLIHTQRIDAVDSDVIPDIITARALASLVDLLNLSRRWIALNPDLVFVFPKGARYSDEINDARASFDFDVSLVPSQTEKEARILVLSHVQLKI